MKILLTGGTGFIGKHLVPALIRAGHQVTILTRKPRQDASRAIDYLVWDGKQMPLGIGLYDVVINLAGSTIARPRWTASIKQDILQSRLDATRACVDYLNNNPHPPRLFISASAVGYYGSQHTDEIHERMKAGKDFPAQVTVAWEAEARKAKVRTILPRIGVVLGDGGALEAVARIYRWYLGGRMGSGKQGFPWIHIEDVVRAIVFFIESETLEGPVNLVAPQSIDQQRFSNALAKEMGVSAPWVIPTFMLKLLLGEASVLLWGGQKAIPRVLQRETFRFQFPEIEGALHNIFNG